MFCVNLVVKLVECTAGQKEIKRIPINSSRSHRREMKLLPINIDYCLLQFDALKFFLEVNLHEGSLPNINFFNVNPQI